ncbi:ferredoxin family protein [Haloferax sp. YSMS24]|uniref:ferredoxin family protein n=1 Tax=unclassified Haloferax TaxID=2625095 RepID=UPI00398CF1DA
MSTAQPHVPDVSIEDRLYTVKYRDAGESHLGVKNPDVCTECTTNECMQVCPAEVWTVEDDGDGIPHIAYENCLECGTCRFGCPHDNVRWEYPKTGGGVVFKQG